MSGSGRLGKNQALTYQGFWAKGGFVNKSVSFGHIKKTYRVTTP